MEFSPATAEKNTNLSPHRNEDWEEIQCLPSASMGMIGFMLAFSILSIIMASYFDFMDVNAFYWSAFILVPVVSFVVSCIGINAYRFGSKPMNHVSIIYFILCVLGTILFCSWIALCSMCIRKARKIYMDPEFYLTVYPKVGNLTSLGKVRFAEGSTPQDKVAKTAIWLLADLCVAIVFALLQFILNIITLVLTISVWSQSRKSSTSTPVVAYVPEEDEANNGPIKLVKSSMNT